MRVRTKVVMQKRTYTTSMLLGRLVRERWFLEYRRGLGTV